MSFSLQKKKAKECH